jgi:dimethylglycine dehydrogenase
MLGPSGRIVGDFTVSCLSPGEFMLTASYGAQGWHMRWFDRHGEEGVRVENVSDVRTGFQVAGPNARALLERATGRPLDLRFMDCRRMTVGMADALVQRVSYTADLGFEVYCDHMSQRHLWEVLSAAGEGLGLRPFGMRAMMSLRLDRWFGSWGREFSPDYTPAETGLDRFVRFNKPADFIGKAAAAAEKATGPRKRLASFVVDADGADVVAWEPIWLDGRVVGWCTSGGFSHWANRSVAQGFLPPDRVEDGLPVEIEILGERRPARVHLAPLWDDPRMRA